MYNKCPNCDNDNFFTTKTVFHDMTVTIKDGNLIDGDNWVESNFQPDVAYGMLVCTKCKTTVTLDDLMRKNTL